MHNFNRKWICVLCYISSTIFLTLKSLDHDINTRTVEILEWIKVSYYYGKLLLKLMGVKARTTVISRATDARLTKFYCIWKKSNRNIKFVWRRGWAVKRASRQTSWHNDIFFKNKCFKNCCFKSDDHC